MQTRECYITFKYVEKLENVDVTRKERKIIEYEYKTQTTLSLHWSQKHKFEKVAMLKGQIPL